MKVKVLDDKDNVIKTLVGSYKNGVFYFKEDQVKILGLKFGGVQKKISIPYKDTYVENGVKVGHVYFDGYSYHPIAIKHDSKVENPDFDNTKKDQHFLSDQAYARETKIEDLVQKAQLDKPVDLKDLLTFLTIGALVLVSFILYFSGNNFVKASALNLQATNKTCGVALYQAQASLNLSRLIYQQLSRSFNISRP